MSDAKLQRTLLRFKSKIDSGEYYEAHQTLRTITNRYVKSKQFKEAIDLLYQGSSILSSKKEYASSSDLITYLIQVYQEANIRCGNDLTDKEYKIKLIELINLLPDTDPSLSDLSKQSIAWSTEKGDSNLKFGDHNLHHVLGVKFLNSIQNESNVSSEEEKLKLFSYAELHLILGTYESIPYYIEFLYQWFKQQSDVKDAGVFLARAVINYSYLKNIKFVDESIEIYLKFLKQDYPNFDIVEFDQSKIVFYQEFSLINFLQLLSITLSKEKASGASDKFLKLFNQFKPLLSKNELNASIEYLGRLYFDLNLGSSKGNQNMLANLMGGLFK